MIRSITRQKPKEQIWKSLEGIERVFIVGCGTCVTLCRTGGIQEVEEMAKALTDGGKIVTGKTVIPVACDELTFEALSEMADPLSKAQAVLVMTCAFGLQTMATHLEVPAIAALDTLFIGKEMGLGRFQEVCTQCGDCILSETGGICPVTSCHKGLVNGPCGGTRDGKCEIDPEKDCAWTLIYERLKAQGRLERMRTLQPPRNHQVSPRPGLAVIPLEEGGEGHGL